MYIFFKTFEGICSVKKIRLGVNYFEKVINYIQLHTITLEIVQLNYNYNYMAFEQSN